MENLKTCILILERGYVKVCRCPDPSGIAFWLPWFDGRTIRNWGTTKGLGELVKGPTSNTVLDDLIPEGTCPVRSIIDIIFVEEESWQKYLTGLTQPSSGGSTARRQGRSGVKSLPTG